jgi:flagellar motor switch protein FliN
MSDMTEAPNAKTRGASLTRPDQNFDLLAGVSLRVSVEVGAASIKLSELLSQRHTDCQG